MRTGSQEITLHRNLLSKEPTIGEGIVSKINSVTGVLRKTIRRAISLSASLLKLILSLKTCSFLRITVIIVIFIIVTRRKTEGTTISFIIITSTRVYIEASG
ncbi:hypothetical protein GQX74_014006 [Glossina fuscipes]|nr:hypothetical protein GQX74_014006 [Glossina fuscipes]